MAKVMNYKGVVQMYTLILVNGSQLKPIHPIPKLFFFSGPTQGSIGRKTPACPRDHLGIYHIFAMNPYVQLNT